jgi:hypothetical protein
MRVCEVVRACAVSGSLSGRLRGSCLKPHVSCVISSYKSTWPFHYLTRPTLFLAKEGNLSYRMPMFVNKELDECGKKSLSSFKAGLSNAAPAGTMAPATYFPGTLIYSVSFNVNQNFKKTNFWITVCFNFFRSTPMNTVFPLLQTCFLL